MTDPDFLRLAGESLYGSVWQSELARALAPYHPKNDLDSGTLRRWSRGEYRIPNWARLGMVDLLVKRSEIQKRVAHDLKMVIEAESEIAN